MLILIFLLSMFQNAHALHVIIDPGHGGKDHGARYHSMREADLVLKVSQKLAALLKADPGFSVSLTREKDATLSLEERVKIAVEKKGDLFLSIHANSSTDSRAHGGEFYFQNQLPPDEESMFLANYENHQSTEQKDFLEWPIQAVHSDYPIKPDVENILKDLQRNYRIRMSSFLAVNLVDHWEGERRAQKNSIRQAPFFVISNVNMPSTLVELGFLSNKKEATRLKQAEYQKTLARSLYNGLRKYKEVVDKSP